MYALWGRSGVHTVKHAEKQIVVLFVAVGFEIEILRHLGQTLVANQFDIFLHETIVVAPGDAGGACLPDVDMELDELIRIEGARRIQAGEMTYEQAMCFVEAVRLVSGRWMRDQKWFSPGTFLSARAVRYYRANDDR
jgi:hypothetical protein